MGIGGNSSSSESTDWIDNSIVSDPHTASQRFRNKIFQHVRNNRDILGYPSGCKTVPYMFASNDLAGIFMEFLSIINKYKETSSEIRAIGHDLITIVDLLIMTYDETQLCTHGCCSYWHSIPKENFVTLSDTLKAHAQINR